jgi:hypothetical protein
VLPDRLSDDERIERGELRRFMANTHSGKSLFDVPTTFNQSSFKRVCETPYVERQHAKKRRVSVKVDTPKFSE